jgi:hypothetical protein
VHEIDCQTTESLPLIPTTRPVSHDAADNSLNRIPRDATGRLGRIKTKLRHNYVVTVLRKYNYSVTSTVQCTETLWREPRVRISAGRRDRLALSQFQVL